MNETNQLSPTLPAELSLIDIGVIVSGAILLLLSSGIPVKMAISYAEEQARTSVEDRLLRSGKIIGKCENILVLIFVLTGSFTALAVVFAAEGIVTRESGDDFYQIFILTGTIVNFTYSILFSILILLIVNSI